MEIRITAPASVLNQIKVTFHNDEESEANSVYTGYVCLKRWWDVLAEIKKCTTPLTYDVWFDRLCPILFDDEEEILTLKAEDEFVYRVVKGKYWNLLQETAARVLGAGYRVVLEV